LAQRRHHLDLGRRDPNLAGRVLEWFFGCYLGRAEHAASFRAAAAAERANAESKGQQ